jgi:uncharacterized protein (TIGR02246 family)
MDLGEKDRAEIEAVVRGLQDAWNAADGIAYGAAFAEDADFVTIRGEHYRGADTIAVGHAHIFRTRYAGTTACCTIEASRLLRPDVVLVHVKQQLSTPDGPFPMAPCARPSLVLTREAGRWRIAAVHNTLLAPA